MTYTIIFCYYSITQLVDSDVNV